LRLARQAGHTRFPLCEDDLSSIIGMIHVKDIFRAGAYQNGRTELRQLGRKALFLPVTLRLDQLLPEFQRNRVHMAMLLDEYGSVVGMVTLENVLEELVGPIQDEFDRETPPILQLAENVFDVDAACPLDVLAETCGIEIPETDAETAGGLVLDLLGRLAKVGDSITINSFQLTVLRADPTRIRKLRLDRLRPETAAAPSGESKPASEGSES
jgi:CBS domain containing-hemolysin-like protein